MISSKPASRASSATIFGVQSVSSAAFENKIYQHVEVAIDAGNLGLRRSRRGTGLYAQSIDFLCVRFAEGREHFGRHQTMSERIENALLEFVTPDVCPIVACALVSGRRAAEEIGRDRRIASATTSTACEAAQKIFRTLEVSERGLVAIPL
jgi:hypothetical protein